jgi:hypothetical protein
MLIAIMLCFICNVSCVIMVSDIMLSDFMLRVFIMSDVMLSEDWLCYYHYATCL